MRKLLFYAVGIAILLGFTASFQPLKAQVFGAYEKSVIVVAPYQELTGGTVIPAGNFGLPPVFLNDPDDGYYRVSIGFPFRFGSQDYTELYISVNGFVTFTRPPNVPAKNPNGLFIYSPSYPVNVIAPFWGDHYYRTQGDRFDGFMPSEISYRRDADKFIVQWKNLNINDPLIKSSVANFQLIMYKSTDQFSNQGNIEFAYGQIGGNPYTTETNVITRGASVGLKGEFVRTNDRADFINGLLWVDPNRATFDERLTNEWTPSGGTDRRITFAAIIGPEAEWWGDGDVDFSKTTGKKHEGMPQNRFVTVNDARLIMRSVASGIPLDSIRRRAAYHADVNHNGRYYYDNNGVRKDIERRDVNIEDNLPSEINTINRVYYQATEQDAALILEYIGAKVPELPWLLDTAVQHGRINMQDEIANGIRFGTPAPVSANEYEIPVYLNGDFNGAVSVKFNVDGTVTDIATAKTSNQVMADYNTNMVVFAGSGNFNSESPIFTFRVTTGTNLNVTGLRFNDRKLVDSKLMLSSVEDENSNEILLQNTPNPVVNRTIINVNIASDGVYNLSVYDALGNLVKTIYSGSLNATSYSFEWNGLDEAGISLEAGMYVYRLTGENLSLTRKLMISK